MRRIQLAGLGLMMLLATSCALYLPDYKELLVSTYQGQSIDQVIKDWGLPQEIKGNAYTWQKREYVNHAGYWTTWTQTVDIRDNKGNVIGTADVETPYFREPYTETIWCDTTFHIDANKNIVDFTADGSDMNYSYNGCVKVLKGQRYFRPY